MNLGKLATAGMLVTASAMGAAQTAYPISGVLESYFLASPTRRGAQHQLSWGELVARPASQVRLTYSFTQFPSYRTHDEAYAEIASGQTLVRAGRMRSAFGFSDWSEIMYNGINHIPLIRLTNLGGGIQPLRNDSGVEITTSVGGLQVQAAALDPTLTRRQILPDRITAGNVRVQAAMGDLLLGLSAFNDFATRQTNLGLDARWTSTRIQVRGEIMRGSGRSSSWGGYVDAFLRLPNHHRTQAVARTEVVDRWNAPPITLQTVGLRQILSPNVTVALNYGWGDNLAAQRYATGFAGWTLRSMFQVRF